MRALLKHVAFGVALTAGWLLAARAAEAQPALRYTPGQPPYTVEVEPHLALGPSSPPGPGIGSGAGLGFRGTLAVWRDGFFNRARDSAAIGFGLDVVHYSGLGGNVFGRCVETRPGPAGTTICTRIDTPGGPTNYTFLPVVLQWNLWLTPQLSLLVEPGVHLYLVDGGVGAGPALYVGGRYRVSDVVNLTVRIGWPTITLGASIFL